MREAVEQRSSLPVCLQGADSCPHTNVWSAVRLQAENSELDLCHDLTEPFEVGKRSRFEWEQTILKTFEIWRKVQNHGGGWARFDRKSRTVEFSTDKPIV
jgi:hypothetical protein